MCEILVTELTLGFSSVVHPQQLIQKGFCCFVQLLFMVVFFSLINFFFSIPVFISSFLSCFVSFFLSSVFLIPLLSLLHHASCCHSSLLMFSHHVLRYSHISVFMATVT